MVSEAGLGATEILRDGKTEAAVSADPSGDCDGVRVWGREGVCVGIGVLRDKLCSVCV